MDIARNIEKILEEYETREISIDGRNYDLYIVPELSEPDLNLFQGFLLIRAEERAEVTSIKNYLAPGSGYTPRISFVFYGDKVLIKDYRKDKHIIRSINKINTSFENKIKKTIKEPSETNFDALFDRKDIIEDFYKLFNNTRNYLAENIQGIPEEDRRIEFADNFLMQMMTLWYLQARGFFNNDKNYLITKFKELSQKRLDGSGFENYKEFLEYFFEKIRENENEQYYEDDRVGRVVVIGPAIFIGTEEEFEIVDIPDNCFYKEKFTEILINEAPTKIKGGIPVLNLFESRDWIEGDIDEYVLGALYEKLITADVRKKTGSYYTPEEITSFIAWNTIEPYLLNSMDTEHKSIDALIQNADSETLKTLFNKLRDIKILDPAVGSGHFLESAIDVLVEIYHKLRNRARYIGANGFEITVTDERGEIKRIDLLDIDDEHFNLYLKFFIILSRNIYGVDINPSALKVARARFFLSMAKHFRPSWKGDEVFVRFPNVHFNLREGNSLIGYASIGRDKVDLFSFSGASRKDKKYIENKIDILDDLREYLESCSEALGLEGDINSDIEDLNTIFSQKKIKWTDIERLLKIKEKLVSILIVSLNSTQASAINDLIDTINDVFYSKFDEKFAEDYDTPLEKVKELKAFHWILDFPEVFVGGKYFDIIIGNPPYGNLLTNLEKELLESKYSVNDISSTFVERVISILCDDGYLTFIITAGITYRKDLSKTRETIYNNFNRCRIYTFDRDNCRFFEGMTLSVSIMFLEGKKQDSRCEFYTSEFFRKTPKLGREIKCHLANNYLLGKDIGSPFSEKHRLPKIGNNAKILRRITTNRRRLKDILNKNGKEVWTRGTGNFWYNAWDKQPYEGHALKRKYVAREFTSFFLVLLNSSLYYIWLRIYGDGRNMTSDLMENCPIPSLDKLEKASKLLDLLSSKLMQFLFDNFDAEHRRFETSNVKIIIDLCDIVLGRLYQLNADEIEYIMNYDESIRKGKKVDDCLFYLIDLYVIDALLELNLLDYEFLSKLIDEVYYNENKDKDNIPIKIELIHSIKSQLEKFGLNPDKLNLHDQVYRDMSKEIQLDHINQEIRTLVSLINKMRR